jgi:hypothetical protein
MNQKLPGQRQRNVGIHTEEGSREIIFPNHDLLANFLLLYAIQIEN